MRIRKRDGDGLVARLTDANMKAENAFTVFEKTARELDAAAEGAEQVLADAELRVLELRQVRDEAFRVSAAHRAKAERIREFIQ